MVVFNSSLDISVWLYEQSFCKIFDIFDLMQEKCSAFLPFFVHAISSFVSPSLIFLIRLYAVFNDIFSSFAIYFVVNSFSNDFRILFKISSVIVFLRFLDVLFKSEFSSIWVENNRFCKLFS
jgi:hypothetical protein